MVATVPESVELCSRTQREEPWAAPGTRLGRRYLSVKVDGCLPKGYLSSKLRHKGSEAVYTWMAGP